MVIKKKDIRPVYPTWTIIRLPFIYSSFKRSNSLQTSHMGWNKLLNFWCKMGYCFRVICNWPYGSRMKFSYIFDVIWKVIIQGKNMLHYVRWNSIHCFIQLVARICIFLGCTETELSISRSSSYDDVLSL